MTLQEAAAQGCRKCETEYRTGVKSTKSHDIDCPRRRGAPRNSSSNNHVAEHGLEANAKCPKCKKEKDLGKKVKGPHVASCPKHPYYGRKSNRPASTLPEEGDPPWRTKGNSWIGRRLLYNPKAEKEEIRSCSKNKLYYEDTSHDIQQQAAESAIKGTIIGFISERDKDRNGNPGFVSEKTGLPAMLFHVAFDQNPNLLNKDFEEWEIKEHCEWIYEESDSDDDESEVVQDDTANACDGNDAFEFDEEVPSPREIRVETKTKVLQTNASSRNVTPKQDTNAGKRERAAANQAIRSSNEIASQRTHSSPGETKAASTDLNHDSTTDQTKYSAEEKTTATDALQDAPNLSNCSSFNEALKSALTTYASNSATRNAYKPPPPVPPPFLSHQEESTLRTALAFVMIKARNKQKHKAADSTSKVSNAASIIGKSTNTSLTRSIVPNHQRPLERMGHLSFVQPMKNESFLGGLLSRHRRQTEIDQQSASNTALLFDREMNHIKDILKLALSSVMPLYKGALEGKVEAQNHELTVNSVDNKESESNNNNGEANWKKLPSAIYDFESSYSHLSTGNHGKTAVERHNASLDGLCQHAATRLARIINEATMRSKLELRASMSKAKIQKDPEKSADSDPKEKAEGSIITESSQGGDSRGSLKKKQIIGDAIVKLFQDDLIGKACQHEHFDNSYDERHITTSRIEVVMATCHVIHRLIYFDQSNSFASECTIAISDTLADIYNNTFVGGSSNRVGILASANALHADKRKTQVVKPNWLPNRTSYADDRYERRSRGIDGMFRSTNSVVGGTKRKNTDPAENDTCNHHALPDISDVLTVNLLRLLECVAEMRLYHHGKRLPGQRSKSSPAADIIREIRSTSAIDLMMPIHLDEAASLYLRETQALHHSSGPSLLRPCAKLMLRVHFFGLIKKLSAYEQVQP